MKKRVPVLIFIVILLVSISTTALARASEYFGCTAVYATALDDGEVLIEYDIDQTHTMLECGAKIVYIFEEQSDGDFEVVFSYHMDDYPEMIQHNTIIGDGEVTYQGTPGLQYYALVGVYAKDSSGSETIYFYTNVVTARN